MVSWKSVELLERRRLLSATLANGLLTIAGTSKADSITVQQDATNVIISDNGVVSSFKATKVKQISASMGAGDDFISLQKKGGTNVVKIPATLSGGGGKDILRGGSKNDVLSGGEGNDSLDGGAGADLMDGGPGFDTTDYSPRTTAVFIHLDSKADDGEINENDNLQVERVYGGAGGDLFKITSADKGSEFFGQKGTDTVDYSELTSAGGDNVVNITLDDVKNDGKSDLDNIHSDIENVVGSKFADSITGSSANNTLIGAAGDDDISGENGDDFISGGIGQDQLRGGNDSQHPDDPLVDGLDTIAAVDPPNGNIPDIDDLGPGSFKDLIDVDDDDTVPNFIIDSKTIEGTSGNDVIILTESTSQISVEVNGKVTAYSTVEFFTVDGLGGNDLIVLSKSDGTRAIKKPTTVFGGAGKDTMRGGLDTDELIGQSGNDVLEGRDGNDILSGGTGNDVLSGGRGDDLFRAGNDPDFNTLDDTGVGNDDMSGGSGNDTVNFSNRTAGLTVTLDDNLANDGTSGELDNVRSDIENLLCGSGNDKVVGNTSANFLSGGAGNDSLRGGSGADKLVGGAGKDTLLGNGSADLLVMGDATKDTFDSELTTTGKALLDFVNGDSKIDFSSVSQSLLA